MVNPMPRGIYDRKPKRKALKREDGRLRHNRKPEDLREPIPFPMNDRPSRTLRPQAGDMPVEATALRVASKSLQDQATTISGQRDEISMLNKEIGILRADLATSNEELERLRRIVDKLLDM